MACIIQEGLWCFWSSTTLLTAAREPRSLHVATSSLLDPASQRRILYTTFYACQTSEYRALQNPYESQHTDVKVNTLNFFLEVLEKTEYFVVIGKA